MSNLILLLDCDNSRLNLDLSVLLSKEWVTVIAVSNDVYKLPIGEEGERHGELVQIYDNSADFVMIARLATELTSKEKGTRVILITRDRALARATQDLAGKYHAWCERYKNFDAALENSVLVEALSE
ncbi:hypothetical protein BCU66_019315 [Vibrio sp. 10N.286.49.B1]|uniref:hypothetical protein n=1 Tax=unclassified Vibrio TaxID=2614977 RepID=UPI001054F064|nr:MULTISPECIES: hypothetical protein [unclassified Vibrio]